MKNYFPSVLPGVALFLSFSLLVFSSFKFMDGPTTIKKGDKIEYQITGEKMNKKIIAVFAYMNENGSAVSGFGCKPESLNKTFTAKNDNQKVGLSFAIDHARSLSTMAGNYPKLTAKILVNGVVVKEASIGEGVMQVELLIGS